MTIAFAHELAQHRKYYCSIPTLTKIIPGEDEINKYEALWTVCITQAPTIALGNAKKELVHLASCAIQSLEASYGITLLREMKNSLDKGWEVWNNSYSIDWRVDNYLIDISNESLSVSENEVLASVLDSVRDLERIGDSCKCQTFH